MHIDLNELDAARMRHLECRGLVEGLIARLRIRDGYELGIMLGLAPSLSNRQAVREWVTQWLSEPGRTAADLTAACHDLETCIEEACQ
jgi:hypothetical protein